MRAGWAYFVSFQQAAKEFAQLARAKLTMPVLAIGGEKSLGDVLRQQMKVVASDVSVVVLKDTGHWVLKRRRRTHWRSFSEDSSMFRSIMIALVAGSMATAQTLGEMRMIPAEIRASTFDKNQIGSSRRVS